ncbi:DUF6114 domain-containing protein [Kitasatospora viridis]|uniref:Uncharacterized protein n=1 Tax=Kitasatospora viridis TaxID=281105 RepID=A0A561TWU6_9ACTN|nr:DUF6114 domain-containing protein [Kitasatospora viridis]TWF91573.1 hypothetical protein FHX73_12689 [Kitasatospora viridis]
MAENHPGPLRDLARPPPLAPHPAFWAAVWTALGGFIIFYLPLAPISAMLHVGLGGITGMAGGAILMALALLMLLIPSQRYTAGVIAVLVGVASFPLTNLGGFFVGMFLAVLGGAMAVGWMPAKPARRWRRFRRIRTEEKEA